MTFDRPNPDALLQQAQQEENLEKQGQLKIYLGAAPGVGKTYAMLTDALQKQEGGLDVIIGIVETHKRQEIENLVSHFYTIPLQHVHYHEKNLLEFDLDAALKRNPGLILIDEMAHTNVPGLRHKKRWQDIRELLDRGIDVYTTLNVQHIESLNDDVARIIQAPVQETVPDLMIERANTIALIDIPPEELLKRLSEGKVYFPAQAELAAESFFRKGNLIALRELALRTLAKRVNEQALLYRQGQGIKQIWPITEKILVCVGPGQESLKLIRAGKRMAASLQAEWIAVYVDSTRTHFCEENRNKAIQNLRFAEQLGAETRLLTARGVVKEIMQFASLQNVTLIMVWKDLKRRWRDMLFPSLADNILRYSGEIDVYTMTGERRKTKRKQPWFKPDIPWMSYAISLGIVTMATLTSLLAYPYLYNQNPIMIYFLGIIGISFMGTTGPSLIGNFLSVIVYEFFFFPPYYTLTLDNWHDFFSLLLMLIVAQIMGQLVISTRRQMHAARLTEHHTASLYKLSRKLSRTRGILKLLKTGTDYIAENFDCDVIAIIPKHNKLIVRARSKTNEELDEKEKGIANWVFEMGQKAGLGTDTLSFSNALYIPLIGSREATLGVLRIHPNHIEHLNAPEKILLIESCAYQIALAMEVDRFQEQSKKSTVLEEPKNLGERLREVFSKSKDAPLNVILSLSKKLIKQAKQLNLVEIEQQGKEINKTGEALNQLVDELLKDSQEKTLANEK